MLGFKKRRAIKILQQQVKYLEDPTFMQSAGWKSTLLAYVEKYFGKESPQYSSFSTFATRKDNTNPQSDNTFLSERSSRAKVLLQKWIEFLNHNDLYKPPKVNFLFTMKSELIVFIIGGIPTIAVAITVFVVQGTYANKIDGYTNQIQRLQDSISTLRFVLTDTIAYNKANIHKKPE